jgi:hypothetical protein
MEARKFDCAMVPLSRSFFAFKKQGFILEPISTDYKTGTSKIFWLNFSIGRFVIQTLKMSI